MKENVIKTWGNWNDDFQKKYFDENFNPNLIKIIIIDDKYAGILKVTEKVDELHIDEIQLLPEFQGKGIGTKIINDIKSNAEGSNIATKLQVLKTNRARNLYERLGFKIINETETHYIMRTN